MAQRQRLTIPRRVPGWAARVDRLALGLGLLGVYAWLSLAAGLAAPGLAGPLTLLQPLAALLLAHGLYRLGERWSRGMAVALLGFVAARQAAGLLGYGEPAQLLGDMLLLATGGLVLHRVSRLPGLHPRLAAVLDRLGGVVVLSSFALLLRLPLVAGLALAVSGAVLLRGYTVLSAIASAGRAKPY